ncbi:MAG: aldehyde dehydrogenase [Elusimicrobia bacterium RIFCSPLOWO2_01_FULL_59_12]|nr:MAG: aldehyde dehydrogenase [Elusimicrobia bacterium RIFCSPLOWO2_01_FULL_59_12]
MKKSLLQSSRPKLHSHFINGRWGQTAPNGKSFENRDPANGQLLSVYPEATRRDVEDAVAAARKAFGMWRQVPVAKRGEILLKAMRFLEERKEPYAHAMTREMGKVLSETRGDVQEAVDTAFYYAGEGRRLFGQTTPSELTDKFAMSVRAPVGVCALITPWNFPMAIPSWKILPALLCGNTVILKPSSFTPDSARHLAEALQEAGVPDGVMNLLYGSGAAVGIWLTEHPGIDLVSFTGSSLTGSKVGETCGRIFKKCSLEMGGKNAQIVMDDADLSLALEGALWGAFGTTGQRCTATSRLIVHERVFKEFSEHLVARAESLRVGNGLDPKVQMGPLINDAQRAKVHQYVQVGKNKDGATLLTGGQILCKGDFENGFFYAPTIFHGDTGMTIAQEEIFGPVTVLIRVKSFDEAIQVLNDSVYGLSGSIYTQDVNRVMRAIRDMQTGITYVNAPTIGAEVHLPFGGVKRTGNGHREAGAQALDIFSEWKAVYIDYSGKLQRAQIDTHGSEA